MPEEYTVETEDNGNGWSFIVGPDGYCEGPIRYRWEAQEWADEMNNGKPPPYYMRTDKDNVRSEGSSQAILETRLKPIQGTAAERCRVSDDGDRRN